MKWTYPVLLAVLSSTTASAQSWTVTGPNGGAGSGSAECSNTDTSRTCARSGTYTTGGGYTTDWNRTRTATADEVIVQGNATRLKGSRNVTRTRNR
ncbi:MAG: hypothetical protein AAFU86_14365 [Pseudomonadota bacterium]